MQDLARFLQEAEHLELRSEWCIAETRYREAVEADPQSQEAWLGLGRTLAEQGKSLEAVEAYYAVLYVDPCHVEALTGSGISLARLGRHDEAIAHFRRSLSIQPSFAKAHNNLGVALGEQGHVEEAIASMRKAVELRPDYAEAHYNLGTLLAQKGNCLEATGCFKAALQHRPDYVEAMINLGLNLFEAKRAAEAVVILQQAVRLRPGSLDALNNLGLALTDLGRFEQAVACWERLLEQQPNHADGHANLGSTLKEMARFDEAVACYDHAIRLRPDNSSFHWNRSLTLLQMGALEEGWREYEWRWRRPGVQPRRFAQPLWDGSPLEGRTILITMEQGLGDMIMFLRYAKLLQERGGRVIVECPASMVGLFRSCPAIDYIIAEGDAPLPFDVHAPLLSLPRLLGTTLDTIPAFVPYLSAEPDRAERWGEKLRRIPGLKIGIAWQGNPNHRWDHHRSIPLGEFARLAMVSEVSLISLQIRGLDRSSPFPLIELASELDPQGGFLDTAAISQQLDLIVTCDTSIAHLAAALGKPTWLLLGRIADWRWLTGRDDSPWYPTLRIYRQKSVGEWQDVFSQTATDIRKVLESG